MLAPSDDEEEGEEEEVEDLEDSNWCCPSCKSKDAVEEINEEIERKTQNQVVKQRNHAFIGIVNHSF